MALFSTATSSDSRFFEGTIVGVDTARSVCKVLTIHGQSVDGVVWLTSSYETPEFKDRVLVTTVTGNPIILGILPRVGAASELAINIDDGQVEADTGNYSNLSNGLVNDPHKPQDLLIGDKVSSNPQGGMLGLLKGGSILAKASRLAQIFICRYDDLVRIVGRNYELFTDVCLDVIANVRGRIYRFKGYSDTHTNIRSNVYKYVETYGDTVLAEQLKDNYYGLNPTSFAALTPADDVIRKYRVLDASGSPLMRSELHLDGHLLTQVQNVSNSDFTYTDHNTAVFHIKSSQGNDSTFSHIQTVPASIYLSYNDTSKVTIDSTGIEIEKGSTHGTFNGTIAEIRNGNYKVTCNANNITFTQGTRTSTITDTDMRLDYGNGNFVSVTATEVRLSYNNSAKFLVVNSSGVHTNSGGIDP